MIVELRIVRDKFKVAVAFGIPTQGKVVKPTLALWVRAVHPVRSKDEDTALLLFAWFHENFFAAVFFELPGRLRGFEVKKGKPPLQSRVLRRTRPLTPFLVGAKG